MALVENMDLNAIQTGVFHYFSEILSMQNSFYMMIAKLKEYRTYLPSHLLNTGHHDDEEETDIKGLGHIGSDSSQRGMMRHTSLRSRSSSTSSQGKSFFGNRKQSTVSGSSGGGSNNRPNTANDVRFSLGLESRDVTIAIVRIVNQDSLMYKMENSDFVFVHGCLTKEIMQISQRFKGDLHDFNASEFIIHWNTIIRQKAHCKQACAAVLAIKDAIDKLNEIQMKDGLPEISCTIGVASGSATIGNMGTQQKRKFVAFGQTEQLARGLDQLNAMWGTKILVNEKIFHSASKFFTMRPLDEMVIPKKPKQIVSLAYELADEVKNEADEWMYEMQHKEKSNRFEVFIQAFSLYQNRDLNNALKFLNQFMESNPLDMPSQKLKTRWQQLRTETKQDTQKTGVVRSLLTTSVIEEEYM
jgi:class 3 adenylate cyclase